MITAVVVMGAASIAGVVSFYDYFKTISVQKAALQYQTQINIVLASSVEFLIKSIKDRSCLNANLTVDLCSDNNESHTALMDPNNTERLLISESTAMYLAQQTNKKNGNKALTWKDIVKSKFVWTVELKQISEQHPLYSIVQPLKGKGIVDYLYLVAERDDSLPRKGRELYLRFFVSLQKVKGTSPGKGLEAEALIAFFPRELANFSLITSGNLRLSDTSVPEEKATPTDSFIPLGKTGVGMQFQSPVFINKGVYLAQSGSGKYANVSFGDTVMLGDGIVNQESSGGYAPMEPKSAGGDESAYNYQNTEVFGGFLRGVRLENLDRGLDCMFNKDPSSSDCNVDTSTAEACVKRFQAASDFSITDAAALLIRRNTSTPPVGIGKTKTQIFTYDLGLSERDRFKEPTSLPLARKSAAGGCSQAGPNNPCWTIVASASPSPATSGIPNGEPEPVVSPAPAVVPTPTASSNAPVDFRNPVVSTLVKLAYPSKTISFRSDLGRDTKVTYKMKYPDKLADGVDFSVQKATLDAQIVALETEILNNNNKILCLNSGATGLRQPTPAINPTPVQCTAVYLCNAGLCDGKDEPTWISINNTKADQRDQFKNDVAALDNATALAGKEALLTISIKPVAENRLIAEVEVINSGYLGAAPSIEFFSYDVATQSNGIDLRKKNTTNGPNQKARTLVYKLVSDQLEESPNSGSFPQRSSDADTASWRMMDGSVPVAATEWPVIPPENMDAKCKDVSFTALGGADWNEDFSKSAFISWNWMPPNISQKISQKGGPITTVDPKNSVKFVELTSDMTDVPAPFYNYSVADRCVVDQSVTKVMGFIACKELYIDYGSDMTPVNPSDINSGMNVTVHTSSPQVGRSKPLQMVGTFVVGKLFIAPKAIEKGIYWRNVYHPSSVELLRSENVLKKCATPMSGPIWMPSLPMADMECLYKQTPAFLRDQVTPIQWTTITPDCGLKDGAASTSCLAPFRAKNFFTLDLYRRIGGGILYDQVQELTKGAKSNSTPNPGASP